MSTSSNEKGAKRGLLVTVSVIKRSNSVVVAFGILIIIFVAFLKSRQKHDHEEDLLIYDFREDHTEPLHLTPINVTKDLVPRKELYPIDAAHRQGLVHSGTWICIQDSEGKTLVLKRARNMVTCPNSYSLLGEHTLGPETPQETLYRGIREEIGSKVLKHIQTVRSLPSSPIYYFRDYGAVNSNRIDRQVTYLWYVQMDRPGAQLPLHIDNEVANHDWIDNETLHSWFNEAATQLESTGSTGVRVCHETILTLWKLVYEEVEQIKAEEETTTVST